MTHVRHLLLAAFVRLDPCSSSHLYALDPRSADRISRRPTLALQDAEGLARAQAARALSARDHPRLAARSLGVNGPVPLAQLGLRASLRYFGQPY